MERDLFDIEELFKSALTDMRLTPPERVWDSIDSRLNKETITLVEKKYNTIKRLSYLLLLLLVGFGVYVITQMNGDAVVQTTSRAGDKTTETAQSGTKSGTAAKIATTTQEQTVSPGNIAENSVKPSISNPIIAQETYRTPLQPKNYEQEIPTANENTSSEVTASNDKVATADGAGAEPVARSIPAWKKPTVSFGRGTEANSGSLLLTQKTFLKHQLSPIVLGAQREKLASTLSYTLPPFEPTVKGKQQYTFNETKKAARPHIDIPRWESTFALTAFYSPDKESYYLKNNRVKDKASLIRNNEEHLVSSTFGVLVDYRLNNRFALQSGLSYSNLSVINSGQTIYPRIVGGKTQYRFDVSSGFGVLDPKDPNGDSIEVVEAVHRLEYINVPIAAKYTILGTNSRLRLEAMAGVRANFLTRARLQATIQKTGSDEVNILTGIEGMNGRYFDGMLGLGAEYVVRRKISFIFMPTARFALTAINKSGLVKTYPRSLGLTAGIKFGL